MEKGIANQLGYPIGGQKGKKSDQWGKILIFPGFPPRSRSVQMQIATETRDPRISIEVRNRVIDRVLIANWSREPPINTSLELAPEKEENPKGQRRISEELEPNREREKEHI